jgi:MFS family permease
VSASLSHIGRGIGANRVVLALSVARLADGVGNSILFIIIPLYVDKLPAPWFPFPDTVRAGLLIALYGLVAGILQPFAGALIDRFDRRKPFIMGGLVLMGAGTLAFIAATRFMDLVLLRALQGIGVALTIPASMALMAIASEKRTRGGSMGIYTTARMTGLASGPLIGGYLYVHVGFDAAFYAGAAFIVVALILVNTWVDEVVVKAALKEKRRFRFIDRELLTAGILGTGLATFVMAGAFSMMTPLEVQFNQRLHESALDFSIAFSALMVSRLLFQLPLGRLSDYLGRKPLIIAGMILMAPATVLLGEVTTTLQLIGVRLMQGIGAAAIAAPALALAADLSKAGGEARQISITTMGFGLGVAAGPLIAGTAVVLSFELPFIIGGLMLLVSAWVVYRYVPETIQRAAKR